MAKDAHIYALEQALGSDYAVDSGDAAAAVADVQAAYFDISGDTPDPEEVAAVEAAEVALATIAAAAVEGKYLPNHAELKATVTAGLDDQNAGFADAESALDDLTAGIGEGWATSDVTIAGLIRVLEVRGTGGTRGLYTNSDLVAVKEALASGLGATLA